MGGGGPGGNLFIVVCHISYENRLNLAAMTRGYIPWKSIYQAIGEILSFIQTDKKNRQRGRHWDGLTDSQIDKVMVNQRDRMIDIWRYKQKDTRIDKWTGLQERIQTDR